MLDIDVDIELELEKLSFIIKIQLIWVLLIKHKYWNCYRYGTGAENALHPLSKLSGMGSVYEHTYHIRGFLEFTIKNSKNL